MTHLVRPKRVGNIFYFLAAVCLMSSTVAGAASRSAVSGAPVVDSQFVLVMIDIPMVGFATRRLVRLPVVFPVPVI